MKVKGSISRILFSICTATLITSCSNNQPRELSKSEQKAIIEKAVEKVTFKNLVSVYSNTSEKSPIFTKQDLSETRFLTISCECHSWIGISLTDNEGKNSVGYIKKSDLAGKNIIFNRPETGGTPKCPDCE
jgi:hypothetical protein